jgi:hypothetical protein
MTKTFTKNDVVRYIYGEASNKTKSKIHIAQFENDQLQMELEDFYMLAEKLSSVNLKAPQRAVDAILRHAEDTRLESA